MRNTIAGIIAGIATAAVVVTIAAVWPIDLGESAGAEEGVTLR
jgi:hypothetical protein